MLKIIKFILMNSFKFEFKIKRETNSDHSIKKNGNFSLQSKVKIALGIRNGPFNRL